MVSLMRGSRGGLGHGSGSIHENRRGPGGAMDGVSLALESIRPIQESGTPSWGNIKERHPPAINSPQIWMPHSWRSLTAPRVGGHFRFALPPSGVSIEGSLLWLELKRSGTGVVDGKWQGEAARFGHGNINVNIDSAARWIDRFVEQIDIVMPYAWNRSRSFARDRRAY